MFPLERKKVPGSCCVCGLAEFSGAEMVDHPTCSMLASEEGGSVRDLSVPKEGHLKVLVRVRPFLAAEKGKIEAARIDIRYTTRSCAPCSLECIFYLLVLGGGPASPEKKRDAQQSAAFSSMSKIPASHDFSPPADAQG